MESIQCPLYEQQSWKLVMGALWEKGKLNDVQLWGEIAEILTGYCEFENWKGLSIASPQ